MTHCDPLTERYKHELREVDPNPRAWFEGPDDLPKLDEMRREPWHRYDQWAMRLMVLASLTFVGFVGWAVWWWWTH